MDIKKQLINAALNGKEFTSVALKQTSAISLFSQIDYKASDVEALKLDLMAELESISIKKLEADNNLERAKTEREKALKISDPFEAGRELAALDYTIDMIIKSKDSMTARESELNLVLSRMGLMRKVINSKIAKSKMSEETAIYEAAREEFIKAMIRINYVHSLANDRPKFKEHYNGGSASVYGIEETIVIGNRNLLSISQEEVEEILGDIE